MKKLLLISLTVLMATLAARADVTINSTNFPDANFRSYLMSEYPSGVITTAQLNARTTLEVNNKGISDMKGVEYFTELTRLSCYSNNLTTINVTSNRKLTYLNLFDNKLTSINVSNNTALEQLYLHYNQLSTVSVTYHTALRTLWVQNNPNLTYVSCYDNVLTNLDVSNCTSLGTLLCYENPNLSNVYGLSTCTAMNHLDVEDCAFTDLSAVASMPYLQKLYARNNRLTTLDVSQHRHLAYLRVLGNTQLKKLYCNDCNLTSLIVNNCPALTEFWCYNNPNLQAITGLAECSALEVFSCYCCNLSELDGLSNLYNLTRVICSANKITSLTLNNKDSMEQLWVDDNTLLTSLNCYNNNNLSNFNVTGCTKLNQLNCSNNPKLEDISGLWSCTAMLTLDCSRCNLTFLDVRDLTALQALTCYSNNLTTLYLTGCTALSYLRCSQNYNLAELTGVESCTAMTDLDCDDCPITSLDVSAMTNLGSLNCASTHLQTLKVTGKSNLTSLSVAFNEMLTELDCFQNQLTILDVSGCTALERLYCLNNQLTSLDVSDCIALADFDCEHNQLTNLTLDYHPELYMFSCNLNQLSELDISGCPALLAIWCNSNQLTSLDLSACPDDLLSIDCRFNQISSLDVGRFTELYQLACSSNRISSLDVANHTALNDLWCEDNNLTSLDASGCSSLQRLRAGNNQLTSLNVSGCLSLWQLSIYYNQIRGSKMQALVDGMPTVTSKDKGDFYAYVPEFEGEYDGNVITVSQVNQAVAKNWNVLYWEGENGWQPYAGSAFLLGDVDGDNNVGIADVTALVDYLLSGDASSINLEASDVDGDSNVGIADVTALVDYLLSGTMGKMMKPGIERAGAAPQLGIALEKPVLEKPRRK